MQFMHVSDIHLGYQQYSSKERFNDFSAVFLDIVEQAIDQQVAFLLIAGDLFEKRTVDPLAMRVAVEGLRMLQEAEIPVVAVEGNHEKAHYRDQYSWVDFLDGLGYLHLLNPRFEEGSAILDSYGDAGGAFVDLPGGIRVYGLKYYGASTGKVFGLFAEALTEMDHRDVDFAIVMAHAGLEGQLDRFSGTLTHNDLAPLREQIDYLALGHIHKPYAVEDWIYNPGSPETWSIEETAWPERGYFLVEVQSGKNPNHRAELVSTPRRPFHRSRLEVDALTEPNILYDAVRKLLRREGSSVPREPAPVVELTLSGTLPFNRFDLDLDFIKTSIEEAWSPLIARVQNRTTPADFEVTVDIEASRPELERAIVRELLERDARYRPAAEVWTQVALDVKRLALESSTPKTVIDHLRRARAELLAGAEGGT
jgi:DNA repair exonuclease SbcCD nuclease subunit